MVKIKPKLFFILGCQRTGTTLARFILESHSKISCVDEHRAYSILQDKKLLKKEISSNIGNRWLGFKTPRITEQMLEPFLADVGINFRTKNNFQYKPIIFLVRNVLDTITSMRELDQDDGSWLKIWALRTVDFWCKTNPYFLKHYKEEIKILNSTKNKDLIAGALYWKFKTESYYNYKNNSIPIIQIHYEDLVSKKKETIKQVLDFLNLKWEDSVLSHEKYSHAETDEKGITVGNNDSKIPIHESSVGKWVKYSDAVEAVQAEREDCVIMLELYAKNPLPTQMRSTNNVILECAEIIRKRGE